jgi:hypothetical protein
MLFNSGRKVVVSLAVLGAAALGGSAIAGAATGSSGSTSSSANSSTAQQNPAPYGAPGQGGTPGQHVANGKTEALLSGDTASKVKTAALAKVPGGTIERVETDADHGSPYEAHVTKSDGTQLEVLVNKDFQVTAVNTMQHP